QKTKIEFQPIRMGWTERKDCVAKNIEFRSNVFEGLIFNIDATEQPHSYTIWWNLKVNVTNKRGKVVKGVDIKILDEKGQKVVHQNSNDRGFIQVELQEYSVNDKKQLQHIPYTVIAGNKK